MLLCKRRRSRGNELPAIIGEEYTGKKGMRLPDIMTIEARREEDQMVGQHVWGQKGSKK